MYLPCDDKEEIHGGQKKLHPTFGGHFDILSDKFYNLHLDAIIKVGLFGISCEKIKDIAFMLFSSQREELYCFSLP